MTQPITLYELNSLVRSALESSLDDTYWLQAELSEARLASNGHFYVEFVQKNKQGTGLLARAKGAIWNSTYQLLAPAFERTTGQRLRAGLAVSVLVSVNFHELYGYTLVVNDIDPDYTLGDMARRRREILLRLEEEGILNDNKELTIPSSLNRIAVISSATAAGYGDFCHQLWHNEHHLRFHLKLFPATMQGTHVEESILQALEIVMSESEQWDAVVIIRGGGSTGELSDFDTYLLAAACAQFPLPILTGIGHERDETVLDHVAHTSLKTPTAVAAFLIAHQHQALNQVLQCQQQITAQAQNILTAQQEHIEQLKRHITFGATQTIREGGFLLQQSSLRLQGAALDRCRKEQQRQSLIQIKLRQALSNRITAEDNKLQLLSLRCEAVNPERILQQGYSLTRINGRIVKSAHELKPGDEIITQLAEGQAHSVVK